MKIYHYTNDRNAHLIRSRGKLMNWTYAWADLKIDDETKEKFVHIVSSPRYVVGLFNARDPGWVAHELWHHLIDHTGRVLLELDLPSLEGVIVRDHGLFSPKSTKEKYGRDLFSNRQWRSSYYEDKWNAEMEQRRYLTSALPIDQYTLGQFEAPEVWIPYEIPVSGIRAVMGARSFQ